MDDFHARHPEIDIHLLAIRRPVDFAMEEVDVAIRLGGGLHPGLQVEQQIPEKFVAVAVPELATSILSPGDLEKASLIEDDWHVMRGYFPEWETLLATLGAAGLLLKIRRFSDAELSIQAAIAGLGVTLSWHSLVSGDLQAGRLASVSNHTIPTGLDYHLVMHKSRSGLGKVAAFRSWLFEHARSQQSE